MNKKHGQENFPAKEQKLAVEGFHTHIRKLHKDLNIPDSYPIQSQLRLHPEPAILVETELDYYGRPQKLAPETLKAWQQMKSAAAGKGVCLHLLSAYRSVDKQCEIIARKLAAGELIVDILKVNAAPGYSEHHTGRAIDLGTTGCRALEEEFELTEAFFWLGNNAANFHFSLSYPRNNPFGVIYEPWHWCFHAN